MTEALGESHVQLAIIAVLAIFLGFVFTALFGFYLGWVVVSGGFPSVAFLKWRWDAKTVERGRASMRFTKTISAWGIVMIAVSLVDVLVLRSPDVALSVAPGALGIVFAVGGFHSYRYFAGLQVKR